MELAWYAIFWRNKNSDKHAVCEPDSSYTHKVRVVTTPLPALQTISCDVTAEFHFQNSVKYAPAEVEETQEKDGCVSPEKESPL